MNDIPKYLGGVFNSEYFGAFLPVWDWDWKNRNFMRKIYYKFRFALAIHPDDSYKQNFQYSR